MRWHAGHDLPPEWLAAYADGELDRNAALAPLKQLVEKSLRDDPDAASDVAEQQSLLDLMHRTAAPTPPDSAWGDILDTLQKAATELPQRRWRWGRLASLLTITAAACWIAALAVAPAPRSAILRAPAQDAAFSVASADEIEIVSIDGDDANVFVVGEMPLHGPIELLQAGEMKVTRIEPQAGDNLRLDIREGPATPMIWVRADFDDR